MTTHRAIAARFKAGESVGTITRRLLINEVVRGDGKYWSTQHAQEMSEYVQRAIREVMKRQGPRRMG